MAKKLKLPKTGRVETPKTAKPKASFSDFREKLNSIGKKKTAVDPKETVPKNIGTDTPAAVFVPSLPGINVVPDEIFEKYAIRTTIKKFATVGIFVAIIFGVVYGGGAYVNYTHAQSLGIIDQQTAALNKKLTELAPYKAYKDGIAKKRTTLAGELTNDVAMSKILEKMNEFADQNGIKFTSVATTITSADNASACVNPDPFAAIPTIGCITVAGKSSGKAATNNFFNSLQGTTGFANTFITGITNSAEGGSTFNGSVSITDVFYSQKYAKLSTPLDDVLKSGAGAVVTVPDKSAPSTASSSAIILRLKYAKYFSSTPTKDLDTLATTVCKGLTDGTFDSQKANDAVLDLAKSATAKDVTDMTKLIVDTQCAANSPKLTDVGGK